MADQPGLYFVGLLFLYSVSSAMVHGLARDAEHVAKHIARRAVEQDVAAVAQPSFAGVET